MRRSPRASSAQGSGGAHSGPRLRAHRQVATALIQAHLADAILTTDYETTAWLRFTQPGLKVIQVNEPQRYPDAPPPPAALLKGG